MNKELEQLFIRRKYFNQHLPKLKGILSRNDIKELGNTCPSCGYPTLGERNVWEICSICFWEDDGQDDQDSDEIYGGPNSEYSLTEHRLEWMKNLNEFKKDNSEISRILNLIDKLIESNQKSDVTAILESLKIISDWFDERRKIEK